jgi:hypothetical protein
MIGFGLRRGCSYVGTWYDPKMQWDTMVRRTVGERLFRFIHRCHLHRTLSTVGRCPSPQLAHFTGIACPFVDGHFRQRSDRI